MIFSLAFLTYSVDVYKSQDTKEGLYYNNASYVTFMTCIDSNFNNKFERITFAWYQLLVLFVFPVVVMCFCYSFVVSALWTSTKEHARLTQYNDPGIVTTVADTDNRSVNKCCADS